MNLLFCRRRLVSPESDLLFSKALNKKIINVNLKQRYYWLLVFFLRLCLIIGITSVMIYSLFWSRSRARLELSKLLESSGYFLSCECSNMFETGPRGGHDWTDVPKIPLCRPAYPSSRSEHQLIL